MGIDEAAQRRHAVGPDWQKDIDALAVDLSTALAAVQATTHVGIRQCNRSVAGDGAQAA